MQNIRTKPKVSVGSKMERPIKIGLDIQAQKEGMTRSSLIEKISKTYIESVKNGDWNVKGLKLRLQNTLLKYQNLYEKYERKVQAYFELEQENESLQTKILNLEVENAKLSSMLEMMEKEKEALALKLTNAPPAHSYQEVKKKYLDFRSENIDLRNSLEEQKKAFEQEKIKLLETLEEQKKVLSVKNRNIKSRKKTPFKKLLSRKRSKTNSENKVEL